MIEKIYDFPKDISLRYESKFIGYSSRYNEVVRWLRNSPYMFSKCYPDRLVNSIYFDNNAFDAFSDALDGMSKRQKVRYRWYGEHKYPTAGTLEIKHKKNNLGWKELYKVAENPYQEGYNWKQFIEVIKKDLPNRANFYLKLYPNPVLMNSYSRQYYQSFDKKIMLTIDSDQKFYRQISKIRPNFTKEKYFSDIITVEMKCDNKDRKIASNLLKSIPLRYSRYSKFVEGLL